MRHHPAPFYEEAYLGERRTLAQVELEFIETEDVHDDLDSGSFDGPAEASAPVVVRGSLTVSF